MTDGTEAGTIVVSYVRQPAEHAEIMRQAVLRLGSGPEGRRDGWYLAAGIAAGAVLYGLTQAGRAPPATGFAAFLPGGSLGLVLLLAAPCLAAWLALALRSRRRTAARLAALRARIRPDLTVTVLLSPGGLSVEWPGASLRFGWEAVLDVALRAGRIEFEMESDICYLPAHAFRNQQEQAAVLQRILAFRQAAAPAKP